MEKKQTTDWRVFIDCVKQSLCLNDTAKFSDRNKIYFVWIHRSPLDRETE